MNPREEQYKAAIVEAREIVRNASGMVTFEADREKAPEAVSAWQFRFGMELQNNKIRKCPHGAWSQVHTVFGCEPNVAYCNSCAHKRAAELGTSANQPTRDCDYCGNHYDRSVVLPVAFNVAAVVVCASMCVKCLLVPAGVGA